MPIHQTKQPPTHDPAQRAVTTALVKAFFERLATEPPEIAAQLRQELADQQQDPPRQEPGRR